MFKSGLKVFTTVKESADPKELKIWASADYINGRKSKMRGEVVDIHAHNPSLVVVKHADETLAVYLTEELKIIGE